MASQDERYIHPSEEIKFVLVTLLCSSVPRRSQKAKFMSVEWMSRKKKMALLPKSAPSNFYFLDMGPSYSV